MIKSIFSNLKQAISHLTKDKLNLLYTMIPFIMGIIFYGIFFKLIYGMFMDWMDTYLKSHVTLSQAGLFLYYLLVGILTLMCFFLINWTFVLIVAIVASPFNSFISDRIEKSILGENNTQDVNSGFKLMIARLITTFKNEFKKVIFIGGLSIVAIVLGYIPILTFFSFLIACVLIAIQFLDYNWSRHDWSFYQCFVDLSKNIFSYLGGGLFFFALTLIPVLNIFVPALATSYFTQVWINKNGHLVKKIESNN